MLAVAVVLLTAVEMLVLAAPEAEETEVERLLFQPQEPLIQVAAVAAKVQALEHIPAVPAS